MEIEIPDDVDLREYIDMYKGKESAVLTYRKGEDGERFRRRVSIEKLEGRIGESRGELWAICTADGTSNTYEVKLAPFKDTVIVNGGDSEEIIEHHVTFSV